MRVIAMRSLLWLTRVFTDGNIVGTTLNGRESHGAIDLRNAVHQTATVLLTLADERID
jgi:hypothetical protein